MQEVCPTALGWLAPYCWTVDLPQGRAREPLLLLKEGSAALGEALQVLLGLCSPEVDYVSSTGTSQPPFFLLLLPPIILWTCQCLHGAALTHTWPSLRVSLVLPLWYSASPTWFPCLTLYIIALGMWRSFVLLRYWTESSRRKVVDSWAGQSSSPKRCPQRLYQLTANTLRES